MQKRSYLAVGVISVLVGPFALADLPKPSDVPPLITKLSSGPAKARAQAAHDLGKIAQVKAAYVKDAIPALLKAAKDKDDNVRKEALVGWLTVHIGRIHSSCLLETLIIRQTVSDSQGSLTITATFTISRLSMLRRKPPFLNDHAALGLASGAQQSFH